MAQAELKAGTYANVPTSLSRLQNKAREMYGTPIEILETMGRDLGWVESLTPGRGPGEARAACHGTGTLPPTLRKQINIMRY